MRVYADYDFYRTEYLMSRTARIPSEDFDYYAQKASGIIRQYTADNIGSEIPGEVGMCCCELAERLFQHDSADKNGVTAEKVGDVSVSYETAESCRRAFQESVRGIVRSWLAASGLLYRGGRLC